MNTNTARQRVLAFVRRRRSATAADIARGVSMSSAAARHHLGILVADGRLVPEGWQRSPKRGRPRRLYRLSDRLLGDNGAMLAAAALDAWLGALSGDRRADGLRRMSHQLAERIGPIDGNLPPTKRLVQLVDRLSELHYEAAWEAGAQGPRIVFGHCPYSSILADHPELCGVDASMLGEKLNADAEQLARIEPGKAGVQHCIFALTERPKLR